MKPPQFAVWMFELLGASRGDDLDDLYPRPGAVAEAWLRYVAPDVETRRPSTDDATPAVASHHGETRPVAASSLERVAATR